MMYQKVNSSIVSKGAMNSLKEMFPLARMFPLTVMHTPSPSSVGLWTSITELRRPTCAFHFVEIFYFVEILSKNE